MIRHDDSDYQNPNTRFTVTAMLPDRKMFSCRRVETQVEVKLTASIYRRTMPLVTLQASCDGWRQRVSNLNINWLPTNSKLRFTSKFLISVGEASEQQISEYLKTVNDVSRDVHGV